LRPKPPSLSTNNPRALPRRLRPPEGRALGLFRAHYPIAAGFEPKGPRTGGERRFRAQNDRERRAPLKRSLKNKRGPRGAGASWPAASRASH
jgi:hypothetical protein